MKIQQNEILLPSKISKHKQEALKKLDEAIKRAENRSNFDNEHR